MIGAAGGSHVSIQNGMQISLIENRDGTSFIRPSSLNAGDSHGAHTRQHGHCSYNQPRRRNIVFESAVFLLENRY